VSEVSPSLVQLFEIAENLCEYGIATASVCATIGTVPEISREISSVLRYEIYSTAPALNPSGRKSCRQANGRQKASAKQFALRMEEAVA
jgi:hypothetical protein